MNILVVSPSWWSKKRLLPVSRVAICATVLQGIRLDLHQTMTYDKNPYIFCVAQDIPNLAYKTRVFTAQLKIYFSQLEK